MHPFTAEDLRDTLDRVKWPLRLTRWGMWSEVVVRSLWPLMAVVLLVRPTGIFRGRVL